MVRSRRHRKRPHAIGETACTLDCIRRGESVVVGGIDDDRARAQAIRFGMAEGATVTCVTKLPAGPVILQVGRQEIAVGRGLAERIGVCPVAANQEAC
jgi:Fe2+ transport system protein FeoA